MSERKYTVSEVDALRNAVEHKYLYGTYRMEGGGVSRMYKESEKAIVVEQQVRTHMLAGHTAEDLTGGQVWYSVPMTKISERSGTTIDGKTYNDHDINIFGRPKAGAVAWEDEAT